MEDDARDRSKDERLRELIEAGRREGHSVGESLEGARERAERPPYEAKAQVYEVSVRLTVRDGKTPHDVPSLEEVKSAVASSIQVLGDEVGTLLSKDFGRDVDSVATTAPALKRVDLAQ